MASRRLLCAAAVVLVCLTHCGSAQRNNTTSPRSNATTLTTSRVDQTVPAFNGVRSCLPFNVLIIPATGAASQSATAGNTTEGRITIEADYNVINSTVATVDDGILTLSLAGGFESQQPINFTITTPSSGQQLRYVANYGSGLLVLGPGLNTSVLRVAAPTVGQVQVVNATARSLIFSSSGVLSSSISGAFQQASFSTSVATGSIAFQSSTAVSVTVDLSGITTLLANVPTGSSIAGRAGGLSKVQYTRGTCSVTSDVPLVFPAPSIFGQQGFGFGSLPGGSIFSNSKCQQVRAADLQPVFRGAQEPQWTCGTIVDGQLSCQGPLVNESVPITWNTTNVTTYQPTSTSVTAGGARKLLQDATTSPSPTADVTVTTPVSSPPGGITTGAQTAGRGSSASASGGVFGPAGDATQTTTSQGGASPSTTFSIGGLGGSIFNPVFIPATPAQAFADNVNAATATTTTAPPTATNATAEAAPSRATVHTTGPRTAAGVAVVNTVCASQNVSRSMLPTLS
eukprot:GHRR01000092.1.p1 GENE.GHRR01000092.1~~GHRR01000092.1.p1  ORF type:complete len:513 (+),score=130.15 GHRR01000092.1:181-1719(+)